ncbi:Coq4 family protein [Pannus brasiliensis CCIBt3594]|uniref:Coq4 family protein n=1 Tax=Pannus brasiliensis CCIBt3594 TaxID=1427578 RepID=A0AAW9QSM5_9CHRO
MLVNGKVFPIARGMISLWKDPGNTLSVYDIEDGLKDSWLQRMSLRYVKLDRATAELLEERYIPEHPDLKTLLSLPADSLGYQYASHLIAHHFDPNFYRSIEVNSEVDYLLLRSRQTHDIWHLVTGYDVDVAGELKLKAFEWSQTRRPMALVLLVAGLLGAFCTSPRSFLHLWNQIIAGYHLGKQAKPFLARAWEKEWEKPLTVWRQELGIRVE